MASQEVFCLFVFERSLAPFPYFLNLGTYSHFISFLPLLIEIKIFRHYICQLLSSSLAMVKAAQHVLGGS